MGIWRPRMPIDRTSCHAMRALRARRGAGLVALAAVVGPGLLAGLSDDDAPGITTYSILGADYGYRLLWVLLLSTVALVLFHEIGARLGVVTGQGLAGLIRERYGVRWAAISLLASTTALSTMSRSPGRACRMAAATTRILSRSALADCSAASPPMPAPREAQVPPP